MFCHQVHLFRKKVSLPLTMKKTSVSLPSLDTLRSSALGQNKNHAKMPGSEAAIDTAPSYIYMFSPFRGIGMALPGMPCHDLWPAIAASWPAVQPLVQPYLSRLAHQKLHSTGHVVATPHWQRPARVGQLAHTHTARARESTCS